MLGHNWKEFPMCFPHVFLWLNPGRSNEVVQEWDHTNIDKHTYVILIWREHWTHKTNSLGSLLWFLNLTGLMALYHLMANRLICGFQVLRACGLLHDPIPPVVGHANSSLGLGRLEKGPWRTWGTKLGGVTLWDIWTGCVCVFALITYVRIYIYRYVIIYMYIHKYIYPIMQLITIIWSNCNLTIIVLQKLSIESPDCSQILVNQRIPIKRP